MRFVYIAQYIVQRTPSLAIFKNKCAIHQSWLPVKAVEREEAKGREKNSIKGRCLEDGGTFRVKVFNLVQKTWQIDNSFKNDRIAHSVACLRCIKWSGFESFCRKGTKKIHKRTLLDRQGMHWDFGSAGAGASWRALGLKAAGAHSTRSLKISGCKRWYPKDMRVRAPTAPVLTHSVCHRR